MDRTVISAFELEFRRYFEMARGAVDQLTTEQISAAPAGDHNNSIAIIMRHVAGNLRSRFTDFLTSDGEKPWRDRETEFARSPLEPAELDRRWQEGWKCLFDALAGLDDSHLSNKVVIRGQELSIIDALCRSLAHTASHVGQIVLWAKSLAGESWKFLSIPPGGSAAYNADPTLEKGLPSQPAR